jgi:hypothetical protein
MKYRIGLVITSLILLGCKSNSTSNETVIDENMINKIIENESLTEAGSYRELRMYLERYIDPWENYTIRDGRVIRFIEDYFNGGQYRVVFHGDTDADGVEDYLVVQEYPQIYKGITRMMLVDRKCNVKLMFDCTNGFYDNTSKIYDFVAIGYRPGEVKCIRLLFTRDEIEFTVKDKREYIEEHHNATATIGYFGFQPIDKDLNLMLGEYGITNYKTMNKFFSHPMDKSYNRNRGVMYDCFIVFDAEKTYEMRYNDTLLPYRTNLMNGNVIKPINIDPDTLR